MARIRRGRLPEEDLGDTTLFEFEPKHRTGEEIERWLLRRIDGGRRAAAFQIEAGRDVNYKVCYPRGSFDRQSISWDLNYFKYYFLRSRGVQRTGAGERFCAPYKAATQRGPRLLFVSGFSVAECDAARRRSFFVDYQGGRKGALQYDIASLLFDAKADLPPAVRQELLDHYLNCREIHRLMRGVH
jgi:aminoglycoside/choline kinase family phosphotransferase